MNIRFRLREPRFSPNAQVVLRQRYLAKRRDGTISESPRAMLWRVARDIATAERRDSASPPSQAVASQFYEMMASLLFLPNSPTLMNAGRPLQQLSACFVL
ncbi:MAG: hypothetical protein NZM29_02265, partial [Nitrospira sp.]|nr:hypothetical protein [Nitrospira sp.]